MTERWRDVAHIGHAELLTPTSEASLEYFTTLLGLTVVAEEHGSVYLRGYGDYEPYCLKLTASPSPGLGHLAVRAWSPLVTIVCIAGDHEFHLRIAGDHDRDRYVALVAPRAMRRRMIMGAGLVASGGASR